MNQNIKDGEKPGPSGLATFVNNNTGKGRARKVVLREPRLFNGLPLEKNSLCITTTHSSSTQTAEELLKDSHAQTDTGGQPLLTIDLENANKYIMGILKGALTGYVGWQNFAITLDLFEQNLREIYREIMIDIRRLRHQTPGIMGRNVEIKAKERVNCSFLPIFGMLKDEAARARRDRRVIPEDRGWVHERVQRFATEIIGLGSMTVDLL